jgi:5-methylcytosine-specific restriction endonuclease McrA
MPNNNTRREFNKHTRRLALIRACYRCESCGSKENLQVHHIGDNSDRSLFNAMILCAQCHSKEHAHRKDINWGRYRCLV